MLLRLLLLFSLVPLVELALLIWLGGLTHWWVSVGLVLATGLLGAWLAQQQGWRAVQQMRAQLSQGQLPADPLLDAISVLIAGVLLLTPGVLTDVAAIALLIPATRAPIKRWTGRWLQRRFQVQFDALRRPPTGDRILDARVIDVPHAPPRTPEG